MSNKITYTEEEVLQFLHQERERAIDIAYAFKENYDKKYLLKKKANNSIAFIDNEIADVCRIIGTAISGLTGLSNAVGETQEDVVKRDFYEQYKLD